MFRKVFYLPFLVIFLTGFCLFFSSEALAARPSCGDHVCKKGKESCSTCPQDCGVCVGCDDGNPCTLDSLVHGKCRHTFSPIGASCDDGDACTQTDQCNGSGSCVGSNPVVCAASDQCHAAGICDSGTGVCSNPAKPIGTACNDGNACTQTDQCNGSGACVGSNPVVCAASDQCHDTGTCDSGTGLCSNPAKTDGATCNDGNDSTTNDVCSAGKCAGTAAASSYSQDILQPYGKIKTLTLTNGNGTLFSDPSKATVMVSTATPLTSGNAVTLREVSTAATTLGDVDLNILLPPDLLSPRGDNCAEGTGGLQPGQTREASCSFMVPTDGLRREIFVHTAGRTTAGRDYGAIEKIVLNPAGGQQMSNRWNPGLEAPVRLTLTSSGPLLPGATVTLQLEAIPQASGDQLSLQIAFPPDVEPEIQIVSGNTSTPSPVTVTSAMVGKPILLQASVTIPGDSFVRRVVGVVSLERPTDNPLMTTWKRGTSVELMTIPPEGGTP